MQALKFFQAGRIFARNSRVNRACRRLVSADCSLVGHRPVMQIGLASKNLQQVFYTVIAAVRSGFTFLRLVVGLLHTL